MDLEIFWCGVRVVSFPLGKAQVHQGYCINCRSYGPAVASVGNEDAGGSAIRQQLILFRVFPPPWAHSSRSTGPRRGAGERGGPVLICSIRPLVLTS